MPSSFTASCTRRGRRRRHLVGRACAPRCPQLTWGHRKLFRRLDTMAAELRRDHSPRKLAEAVALYHVVVEGTLAQPGQHIIESSLETLDLMPGFREGIRNVALDEQRHIAFGVRLLADLYEARPDENAGRDRRRGPRGPAVGRSRCRRRLAGRPFYTECFGFTMEDLFEEGARSNEARLRAIGLPLDQIAHFPFPMDIPPRARGEQALALLRAGFLGQRNGPIPRDLTTLRILFDLLARNARGSRGPARHDDPVGLPRRRSLVPAARGRPQGRGPGPGSRSRPSACGCASTTSPSSSHAARSRTRWSPAAGCARTATRGSC